MTFFANWRVKVKERMGAPLTAEDHDVAVDDAEREVSKHKAQAQRAHDALNAGFDRAVDSGDEVGLRRLRDAVEKADRNARDAEDTLARMRGRRDRFKEENRHQVAAGLRTEVERVAALHRGNAELLRQAAEYLVGELEKYLVSRDALRNASDSLLREMRELEGPGSHKLTAVNAIDYPATFATEKVVGLVAQDLCVLSSGKWPTRNIVDLWALSQGPRFDRRVADEIKMLLRQLPHPPTPGTPPPAA